MKKLMNFSLIFVFVFSLSGAIVSAQTTTAVSEVERPGVLPTSPFYFLKEWVRGIQSAVTFNPVAKAELEIKFADERAVEARVLAEEREGEGLDRAFENYRENMERLEARLRSLEETSDNPNVERLVENLTERSLLHQELFSELKEKYSEIREEAEAAQAAIDVSLTVGLENADELKTLGVIGRLESRIENEEAKAKLLLVEEKLVSRFEGKVESGGIPLADLSVLIEELPEAVEAKLKILDTVRNNISADAVRTQVNVIRQDLLGQVEREGAVSEEKARIEIENAGRILNQVQAAGQTAVTAASRQLIEQAKFNLEQARRAFEAADYGRAFGLATSASAIAKNAWRQLTASPDQTRTELEELKAAFDALKTKIREKGLTQGGSPRVFELLSEAETKIARAIASASTDLLKEIRVLMSSISSLIEDSQSDLEREIDEEFRELDEFEKEFEDLLPADAVPVRPTEWKVEIKEGRFNPPTLKIKKGDMVTWVNADGSAAWPASAVHPTHTVYPGSSIEKCGTAEERGIFDACKSLGRGESWSFTFNEAGTWRYHNHVLGGSTGVVEVTE